MHAGARARTHARTYARTHARTQAPVLVELSAPVLPLGNRRTIQLCIDMCMNMCMDRLISTRNDVHRHVRTCTRAYMPVHARCFYRQAVASSSPPGTQAYKVMTYIVTAHLNIAESRPRRLEPKLLKRDVPRQCACRDSRVVPIVWIHNHILHRLI